MSKYKGESEERLRDVFERASERAPRSSSSTDRLDRGQARRRRRRGEPRRRPVALADGRARRPRRRDRHRRDQSRRHPRPPRPQTGRSVRPRGSRSGFPVRPAVARSSTSTRVGCPSRTTWTWTASRPGPPRVRRGRHRGLTQEAAMMTPAARPRIGRCGTRRRDGREGGLEAAHAAVEPSAMREYVAEQPTTDFTDVGGLPEAKEKLERAVTWPLTYGPSSSRRRRPADGDPAPRTAGTGKTLLARGSRARAA